MEREKTSCKQRLEFYHTNGWGLLGDRAAVGCLYGYIPSVSCPRDGSEKKLKVISTKSACSDGDLCLSVSATDHGSLWLTVLVCGWQCWCLGLGGVLCGPLTWWLLSREMKAGWENEIIHDLLSLSFSMWVALPSCQNGNTVYGQVYWKPAPWKNSVHVVVFS